MTDDPMGASNTSWVKESAILAAAATYAMCSGTLVLVSNQVT